MEDNKYYVYMHIKETTGEPFYIGKGKGTRMLDKSKRNKHWNNVVNKHGFDVIFLEKDLTEKEAFEKEIYWIKRIGRGDLGLGSLVNFTDGGEGGSGAKRTEEQKSLISLRTTGENNGMYGKKMSDETKLKMSDAHKGRKISDETKKKHSIRMKNNNFFLGKKHSNETKLKMSESAKGLKKGIKLSKEHIEKVLKSKSKTTQKGKMLLDLETGIYYYSKNDLIRNLNINKYFFKKLINNSKRYIFV
jgi:hypothetical protein